MCFSVMVENDIKRLSKFFDAKINQEAFNYLADQRTQKPELFKTNNEERIYAKDWAPILISHNDQLEIRPMRYQLLPSFCKTPKYTRTNPKTGREIEVRNTYNARLDSLMKAKAWQKPFMRYHGILTIKSFYEWVDHKGKTTQINFFDSACEYLHIPCLFDNWYSEDKKTIIQSFAIITTDPTPEILAKGHDRCPIVLQPSELNTWLNPQKTELDQVIEILNRPISNTFSSKFLDK